MDLAIGSKGLTFAAFFCTTQEKNNRIPTKLLSLDVQVSLVETEDKNENNKNDSCVHQSGS